MVHWSWDHQNPKALMLRPLRKMLQHRQTDSSIEDESDQLLVTASGQKQSFNVPTNLGAIHSSALLVALQIAN